MEANLVASLQRGECIPLFRSVEKEGPPLEPPQPDPPGSTSRLKSSASRGASRVRTISGMNEHLLAQLALPVPLLRVSSTASALVVVKGRPPLPRPPPTASNTNNCSASTTTAADGEHLHEPSNADDDTDLELSPEMDLSKHASDENLLRGEDLLDGDALLMADLEASDDDSENDPAVKSSSLPPVANPADHTKPATRRRAAAAPYRPPKVDQSGLAPLSHIRRNTAGTVHVKGTMEKPDVDGTIHVVCGVIRAHI